MPTRAKSYIIAIITAGAVTIAFAAALWICPSPLRFFACLALTVLASTFKVKLPGMDSCITPNLVPLLFSAGTMLWQESVALAAVAGVVQTLWKPRGRVQPVQIAFNASSLAISMGSAYSISHALAPINCSANLASQRSPTRW